MPEKKPMGSSDELSSDGSGRESAWNPSHEQIARLAYALWEERGRVEGSPEQDWFGAERQLRAAIADVA